MKTLSIRWANDDVRKSISFAQHNIQRAEIEKKKKLTQRERAMTIPPNLDSEHRSVNETKWIKINEP